ncbi:MAG: TIGR02921 family PEP-CTERM protein [Alphaproteobacteria bacterium]|nr:TIGR02921 family PEP-CTERM protein [Alphaproteobacteria bacterium]
MRELLRMAWRLITHRGLWGHGIFWSWHLVYLCLLGFGILPYVAAPLAEAWWQGYTPTGFFLTCVALTLLPLVSLGLGALRFLRQPDKLLGLFYGLAAPALTVLMFRLFVIKEMTSGVAYVGLVLVAAMLAYAVELFRGLPALGPEGELLRLIAHSAMPAVALYFGALVGAFVPPLAVGFVLELIPNVLEGLWEMLWRANFRQLWGMFLGGIFASFFLLTATYWLLLVPAGVTLMGRSWWRAFQRAAASLGRGPAWAVTALSLVGLGVGFAWTTEQPQAEAFSLLEQTPTSDAERMALLEESGVIRAGLLNAALASYRYPGTTDGTRAVADAYEEMLHLGPDAAQAAQDAWDAVASPFLYEPVSEGPGPAAGRRWAGAAFGQDNDDAERLYEEFFDLPMQKAEQRAMLTAISANYDTDAVEAGLLNAGERRVRLVSQEVTVVEHAGFAEVEVAEVYLNQTYDPQEIVYLFNLPRSAAMTGLWLGMSPDKAEADVYTVAPRGAAQSVYIAQRERRMDPALLEQVGPQQYRLRAFPVPAKPRRDADAPAPLYMWFTYTTPATAEGWPAPRLAEARNIYWDADTERLGLLRELDEHEAIEGWFPETLPAADAAALTPRPQEVRLADGSVVRATPQGEALAPRPTGLQLAVVLDTSRSMAAHADAAMQAVDTLRDRVQGANAVDVVLTRSPYGGDAPVRLELGAVEEPIWYGGHSLYGVIEQGAALLSPVSDYDAVLVLTDEGALTLAEDREALALDAPLWLVHLDGALAPQYDDAVLEAVQASGGGVAGSLADALSQIASRQAAAPGFIDLTEDRLWTLEAGEGVVDTDPAFAPMAARQLALLRSREVDLGALEALDSLHTLAVEHSVVTPYSSMIVLVNERQREALQRAAEAEDRFEREVETGVEPLGGQSAFSELTATPEPEEWALIGVAVILLLASRRRGTVGWVAV